MVGDHNKKRYARVAFYATGRDALKTSVASVVAAAFIGPRPTGLWINHINHDPSDNRPGNLEYCTPKQNSQHAANHGRSRGQKVLPSERWQLVKLRREGKSFREIGNMYGMHHVSVRRIVKRQEAAT